MATGEQLPDFVDDPGLAVPFVRREAHPQEVELDAGASLDDREVIVERWIGAGAADAHARPGGAWRREDVEPAKAAGRPDGMGRDGRPGPARGACGGAMAALLLGRHPGLVRPDLADDPGPDPGLADAHGRLAN